MNGLLMVSDIELLIASGETSKIEWKKELHCNRSNQERSEFIKDFLSLVNAFGEGPSHLLIGLEDKTGKCYDIASLDLREENLQQLLREYIEPPVIFSYRTYDYDGVKIGIFEIPRSHTRFHLASKQIKNEKDRKETFLEQGMIYIRDGRSKRPISSSVFMLLRSEIEERSRAEAQKQMERDRPDLEVSFQDSVTRFDVTAGTGLPPHPHSPIPDNFNSWKITPQFCIKNVGTAPARDAVITITLPAGCTLAKDQYISSPSWGSGFRVDFLLLHHDHREINLPRYTFNIPKRGCTYPIGWSAICDGMKQEKTGVLEIEVAP